MDILMQMLRHRVDQSIMRFLNYKSNALLSLPQALTSNTKLLALVRMYIRVFLYKLLKETFLVMCVTNY